MNIWFILHIGIEVSILITFKQSRGVPVICFVQNTTWSYKFTGNCPVEHFVVQPEMLCCLLPPPSLDLKQYIDKSFYYYQYG